ncbi:MAG: Gfo/Idh/MocA family oxidoreductase [Chloroflexi bacterium]|nr:Gfo/Idh/MocA family oxidoreductase [Chloroflexota bacterium]
MSRPGAAQGRFLVIGCGSIGKRHIDNLKALGTEDVLAFDVRVDRREEVKSRFDVEVLGNLEEAWARNPNVALITVPTSLHLPLALEAVRHGCHLFIEKPLADRMDGLGELLRSVRERKLVTLVGCNMRFHPGLMTVKKLLQDGAVGRVVAARVEVGQYLPDWHPWEDYRYSYSAQRELGGGVILDDIHEIDYVRWMLGEIQSVACFAGKLSHLEIGTEDTAAIILRFASGSIGEVHLDYVQRAYSRTCRVIGDEGTIHWDYTLGEVRWYSAAARAWQVFRNPPSWEPNQMYVDEMRHFLRCLSRQEESTLDVFGASRALAAALAAKTSAENGQIVSLGS